MLGSKQSIFFLVFLVSPFFLFAQSKKITGTVTDSSGRGIPLVTVTEKGTKNSTVTISDGNFTFNVSGSNSVLVISSVGYVTKEIKVNEETSFHIVLPVSVSSLGEVVVVGYGTQRKKDVTGAVTTINTKNFNSIPVSNAGEAMEGKAAGVQVISSGSPGSNVTFRIRGTGTINNADPLLVIDGVPTDAPLNNLNPDDIASIDVLKDASAAAIYGSRGANGVVLITTKHGAEGKGHLSFDFFTAWQKAASVVKMLNAPQFAALNNELLTNGNQNKNPAFANPDTLGVGTNWLGALFRTAPMQNY
ncbi:MAG TPA: TonB-dependent receptor plug domain-containing protein, partial [Ginsengibacter sp.]|nr:TonB-dependent receptor plug domain-containing protein [Ginsengibacter sp.]